MVDSDITGLVIARAVAERDKLHGEALELTLAIKGLERSLEGLRRHRDDLEHLLLVHDELLRADVAPEDRQLRIELLEKLMGLRPLQLPTQSTMTQN